jgi:predicted RND superfamily exporter protein
VPSEPTRTSRLLAQLVAAVLRRRGLSALLLALVFATALLGILRLRIDFSSTAFYGDDSIAAARLKAFHDTWGADDDTLLVLVHPVHPEDPAGVLERERLEAIAELSAALRSVEQVRQTSSIAELTLPLPELGATLGSEPRTTTFVALAQRLDLAAQPIETRRALLEQLPFVPVLLSSDGRDTVIVVELAFSSDDMARTRALVTEVEAVLDEHEDALVELGLAHEIAGVPGIRAGFFELIIRDQAVFVPLTLLLIGLALYVVFRRLHGVLIPALAAMVPTAMLVGIMGWMGEPIGLLNQAYFTLLPVIAVADAIHMIARFHEERRRPEQAGPDLDGLDVRGLDARGHAIVRACSHVGLACLMTSLTTAAGFASLATASMPILRAFGLYAALGVALAFVVGFVLVPLLLSLVRDDRLPPPPAEIRVIDWAVAISLRRPLLVVLIAVGLVALALIPARRVEVDNTLSGLLETDHPISVASRRVDERLGGVLGLELEILAPDGVDLRTPESLQALHGFERWLAEQPRVRSVDGLASAVAGVGVLRGSGAEVPLAQAEIDARLELLAPHAPLDRLVRDGGQRLRIHVGMPDAGGQAFVLFAARAEAELHLRLAAWPQLEAHATGTPLMAYRGVNSITQDLRSSFAQVFVVVVAAIAISFRSLWPALVAILPNLAPLLFGYALLGLLGKVLDPLAAVILTLALGLAVDNTLHVMARTREELARHKTIDDALRDAIRHSSWAVAVTSMVIVGGLLLDLGSSFPPLQMLGLLGSLVISLALLANLTVLPASLALLRGRGLSSRRFGGRT